VDEIDDIRVRRAARQDGPELFRLAAAFATSFTVDQARFEPQLEAMLAHGSVALMVATIDDVVVGYVAASIHPTLYANGPVGWIEELMVDEAHRKAGVGRLLVSSVEEWVRSCGGAMVSLATRRAGAFWSSIGFEESATYFRRIL
jgi:GNAT superfamily N-acetyltransferase